MVLKEIFDEHRRTCSMLPVSQLLESDAAMELGATRPQTKSPLRGELPGRPASAAAGRAHSAASGTANRPSPLFNASGGGGSGGSASGSPRTGPVDMISGGDSAAALLSATAVDPAPPAKRSRSGPSGSRSGSSGSRSGQRPISAEAEQRRMQFDAGLLTVDCVCGVRQGEKLCLRPLNCKYHSVSVKRLVEGRTRPFDDLLAEFNAEQLAARKGGSRSGSHRARTAQPGLLPPPADDDSLVLGMRPPCTLPSHDLTPTPDPDPRPPTSNPLSAPGAGLQGSGSSLHGSISTTRGGEYESSALSGTRQF